MKQSEIQTGKTYVGGKMRTIRTVTRIGKSEELNGWPWPYIGNPELVECRFQHGRKFVFTRAGFAKWAKQEAKPISSGDRSVMG